MQQILDATQEQKTHPILRQAFRPFFLFGALFSAVAIAVWVYSLFSAPLISPPLGLLFWHSHEMVFGFVGAVIAGFLLTAVQNWTGYRAINGKPLLLLLAIWFVGRIVNAADFGLPIYIIAIVQLSFWLSVAYNLLKPVFIIKQYRNLIFLPILTGFTLLDVGSYYFVQHDPAITKSLTHTSVFLVVVLMTVMSGRVFPMFTANGTNTQRVNANKSLEMVTIAATLFALAVPIFLAPINNNAMLLAALYLFTGCCHIGRAIRWRPWVTLNVPLVWSLHVSYWFIPVGMLLIACHYAGMSVSYSAGLHAITVGGISLMILAMISRVSLGHSGRQLTPSNTAITAFYLLALAAVFRVLAEFYNYTIFLSFSAAAFGTSFLLFVLAYGSILTSPRPDGRPG